MIPPTPTPAQGSHRTKYLRRAQEDSCAQGKKCALENVPEESVSAAWVTVTWPWAVPAGLSAGTNTSTHTARLWPAGTSSGKALRFSPTNTSTSGKRGSIVRPTRPRQPEALVALT